MQDFQLSDSDRFLLISAKPAPNGGLHLGHIAGPYLRQDMLRRHYMSRGARVTVVGGTDPIDSFISLRAMQDDAVPDGVAQHYFEQIQRDFRNFDIHYDAFIDPLSPQWSEHYAASFAEVVEHAARSGGLEERSQPFPFVQGQQRGASGAWLCGFCPDCDAGVSGYFCESCGAHFEPVEVRSARLRIAGLELEFRPETDLFFAVRKPRQLLDSLQRIGVSAPLRAVVERQFERGRTRVRLSEHTDWGVPMEAGSARKYFGHGLLYGYCRLLGRIYQQISGDAGNPFDAGSAVTSVNLFGIDNTVSHMVNIQAIGEEVDGWKGFDGFVVNRFYLLEGKKFSTSARHLIWASDLIEVSGAHSDAVRFVISATSPTHAERDLRIGDFLHWYNTVFIDGLCAPLLAVLDQLGGDTALLPDPDVIAQFAPLWARACEGHAFERYDPAEQVQFVLDWAQRGQAFATSSAPAAYAWLKTMALLVYPITPRLATTIWQRLGEDGEPNLARLAEASIPGGSARYAVAAIDADALFRAMPPSAVERARAAA